MEQSTKIKTIMARNVSNEEIITPYMSSKRKATYWFNILNREVFNSKLTKFRNVIITENLHNKKGKIFAECEGFYDLNEKPIADLHLTDKFKSVQQFISILGHEMIHLYQWIYEGSMNHSKQNFFRPWEEKFAKHGIKLATIY